MAEPAQNNLPDIAPITQAQVDKYWSLWTTWRAFEKRYPPSLLGEQDAEIVAVFTNLDSMYEIISEEMRKSQEADAKRRKELENAT